MSTESLLRLLKIFICEATLVAAVAIWIFALCNESKTLRLFRFTAKSEIIVFKSRYQNDTIATSL